MPHLTYSAEELDARYPPLVAPEDDGLGDLAEARDDHGADRVFHNQGLSKLGPDEPAPSDTDYEAVLGNTCAADLYSSKAELKQALDKPELRAFQHGAKELFESWTSSEADMFAFARLFVLVLAFAVDHPPAREPCIRLLDSLFEHCPTHWILCSDLNDKCRRISWKTF